MARLLLAVIALAALLVGGRRGVAAAGAARARETAARAAGKGDLRRALRLLALLLVASCLLGLLVFGSGIVPNRASSAHWAITAWFLSTATRQSVVTHSLGIETPPLGDPALLLKGAGHFETGCSPCHGNPDNHRPRIAGQMMPPPPRLAGAVSGWTAPQLFTIVKHGIKFAGMPAWPAQERDDEVWAMVAFLRALPGLDAASYRRLAHGDAAGSAEPVALGGLLAPQEVPGAVETSCARCHGRDGLGRGTGAFPRLAGQREGYLAAALEAYAGGKRHSGIMEPVAAGLARDELRALARYYAGLPPPPPVPAGDREAIARGRMLARSGLRKDRVPACTECHGPFGQGERMNEHYPLLGGQYPGYLELQLQLFQEEKRGGSPYGHVMRHVGIRLTREQMRDVALYFASLGSGAE